jgi:hypothetical protein
MCAVNLLWGREFQGRIGANAFHKALEMHFIQHFTQHFTQHSTMPIRGSEISRTVNVDNESGVFFANPKNGGKVI